MFRNTIFFKMLLRIPAPAILLAIWVLSSQSALPQMKGILGWDKLQHLAAYAALAASTGFWIPLAAWRRNALGCFLLLVIAASVYGVIDEIHQLFVPGRFSSVWDWAADTLGALAGAGISLAAARALDRAGRAGGAGGMGDARGRGAR